MLASYAFAKRIFEGALSGRNFAFEGAGQMFGELTALTRKYAG